MTTPAKPKVVHVYRTDEGHVVAASRKGNYLLEYLGEYVPRASGPVPAVVVTDEFRCMQLEAELATLRVQALPEAVVKAVRKLQSELALGEQAEGGQYAIDACFGRLCDLLEEADAKEREG